MISAELFAQGVAVLQSRWPRHEITPELAGVYAEALADLTGDEFIVGVKRAAAELEFFPSAKQIREFARPELPASVEAGAILTQIIEDDDVAYSDPRIGRCYDLKRIGERYGLAAQCAFVAIGGAARFRNLTEDDFRFTLVKEWRAAYEGFAADLRARGEIERLSSGTVPALGGATMRLFPEMRESARKRLADPTKVSDVELPMDFRERAAGED